MPIEDLLLLLEQAAIFTNQVMAAVAGPVRDAGMQIWQGLALIMLVWTGGQMMLGGAGFQMAAVVRLVIGLSIPLGMLRFYTAALPGTGRSVPDLITGMGGWLQGVLVSDVGTRRYAQLQVAMPAFREALGTNEESGGVAASAVAC